VSVAELAAQQTNEQACGPAVEVQASDLAGLSELLASVFGGQARNWLESFAHWWDRNPARHAGIPRGWIVHSANGAPVAFTANIPFRYVIAGQTALCCVTGSTAVHPDWRGRGLARAVATKFIEQPDAALTVGVDSTPAAFAMWQSLGMQALNEPWLNTTSRIVADGFALAAAPSQAMGLPPIVGRAVGHCLTLWLAAAAAAGGRRSRSLAVARIDNLTRADGDALSACRASHASTYAWRDFETLNWLYFGSDYLKRSRVVLIARSGTAPVGYLAMKRWNDSYYLLECRCRDADPGIAQELILAARDFGRQVGAPAIVVRPYASMIRQAIPRTLSLTLARPETTYCYRFKGQNVATDDWETAPGDGDVSLN
jgi:GNAT superfamily N-acetyltransferase